MWQASEWQNRENEEIWKSEDIWENEDIWGNLSTQAK